VNRSESHLKAVEGKYEILEKISEGGMGAVYKVRHRLLERIRVIKIMRPQLAADREMRTRFLREARLAGSLKHPNIAQVYDFAIEKEGEAFLVMEFVNGITLQEILTHWGPPSPSLTLDVACQTLDALEYLHKKGVIHRDLSPDNIMVTQDKEGKPVAKLIDLGIAKLVESESNLTAQGSFIGKVRYSSPELFKTQEGARIDIQSDLYAMGLVLYEVLTGKHPMGDNDVSGYIAAHLFKAPASFDETDPEHNVPDGVRESIFRSLAKEPGERQANAGEFRRELIDSFGVQRGSPVETAQILKSCADLKIKRNPDTQERLDAHFEFGAPSGEATDIRALLEKAEPTALQQGPSPVARTLTLPEDQQSSDGRTEVLATGRKMVETRSRTHQKWLISVAAVLVVVALGFLWISKGREKGVLDLPKGTLILDAQPWAEISSIRDSEGNPIELEGKPTTPYRIGLAPGRYTAVLEREGEIEELNIDLTSGSESHRLAHFSTIRPEDYFSSVGLDAGSSSR